MKMIAGFTKQLKEELLEVVNHTHTVKRDQKSVYHRRTSLKPILRKANSLYTTRGESYESEIRVILSQECPTSHDESRHCKISQEESCQFQTSQYHIRKGDRKSERDGVSHDITLLLTS